MSLYSQLTKAGLKVNFLWGWEDDFDDGPSERVVNSTQFFRKSILQEAKARKCKRKECRKQGCDCE